MLPNIHIFGIQGSGKDTQAALLAKEFNLEHLSSGAMLRARAGENEEIAHYLSQGLLVPLDLLYMVIDDALEKLPAGKGVVCAGITRTLEELHGLKSHWNSHNLDSPFGILLDVTDEVALERALLRNREDDTLTVLQERFALYHSETEPVLEALRTEGRLITVNGMQPIEVVHNQIKESVADYLHDYVSH